MEWSDQGTVLLVRPHGETSAIVEVFTARHGRHAGVVRGGISRRLRPHLQPGTEAEVVWRARLEEHLGAFTLEPLRSRAAVLGDRAALAGLNAVTALLTFCLPERQPHPHLHALSNDLLDSLGSPDWGQAYLLWELALLDETGFGLDLSVCAVTGVREGLVHVSPRTGRAVSAEGAGRWADRLLPLPGSLRGRSAGPADLAEGLRVTGHFLARHMGPEAGGRPLPAARERLVALLGA